MADHRSSALEALRAKHRELIRQAKAAPDPQTRSALFAQASFVNEDIREHMGEQAMAQIQGNTMDFHGVSVDAALRTLKATIKTNTRYKTLKVITGKGNHSRNNKARIKPAIIEFCAKENIVCRDLNNGTLELVLPD